jgi:CheY-like chemotaxis protein
MLVLIVEDEHIIQLMLEDPFVAGGYDVACADCGEDAVAMLQASGAAYDALITDLNLGRDALTGWEVAKCARALNPALPVVYMTGDGGGDWAANGVANSVLLLKPFAPMQAVMAVSRLLNPSATPTP